MVKHIVLGLSFLFVATCVFAVLPAMHGGTATADEPERTQVPKALIAFDDGDTIEIRWPKAESPEMVRILGLDTPEVMHLEHDLPFAQPFGEAAAGFLRGCLAVADEVELQRAPEKDPYGRTLGYLFLDGKNYSVLAIEARLAVETVTHFGDNGLPEPAAACVEAAKRAGPVPFEPPFRFRRRMSKVSKWMRDDGSYPRGDAPETEDKRR